MSSGVNFVIFLLSFLGLLGFSWLPSTAIAGSGLVSLSSVVEKVAPAVVSIRGTVKEEVGQDLQAAAKTASGSGFIVDSHGYIITNQHVVEGLEDIRVSLSNDAEKSYPVQIIGRDEDNDIVLLKINTSRSLPYLKFGDSDKTKVGDAVIAIGNPFAIGPTVTSGIISAKARVINDNPWSEYLQTDADINLGNSGGPLCDVDGAVIGVNVGFFSPTGASAGIGFALPSKVLVPIVQQLKARGEVRRGGLGLTLQELDPNVADLLGLGGIKGVATVSVIPDGAAAAADIKPGDIIVEVNGKWVASLKQFLRMIGELPIGREAEVTLFRDRELHRVKVTIKQRGAELDKTKVTHINSIGASVRDITPELRDFYSIPSFTKGVVVAELDTNSPLLLYGVKVGDVISKVDRRSISNVSEFVTLMSNSDRSKTASDRLFLVGRGPTSLYLIVPMADDKV